MKENIEKIQTKNLGLTEVLDSASRLWFSGVKLVEAKTEVELQILTMKAATTIALIVMSCLGFTAILSGLIIEIGRFLEGRYGLGSLIVGAGCILFASLLALVGKKRSHK